MALAFTADSMEILILSILTPALHCEWNLSDTQQAALYGIVYLGKKWAHSPRLCELLYIYASQEWCSHLHIGEV